VSLILNIDTAVQTSSVCLAQNDTAIDEIINPQQKDSAAWLQVAIKELLHKNNLSLDQIYAIAVSEGPGSYTGLRVGMSTAKGLCYVLQKPLITVGTLKMMAAAAPKSSTELLCPMIDARRMEVFTAVFDAQLNSVVSACNLVLNTDSFGDLLQKHSILFFGNGSAKFQPLTRNHNAVFADVEVTAAAMASLSYQRFVQREFADIAYSQPFYGKDFHSTAQ
jgi:tRNA threonylcarbamoyladenosine biosynthesis protein TsaB